MLKKLVKEGLTVVLVGQSSDVNKCMKYEKLQVNCIHSFSERLEVIIDWSSMRALYNGTRDVISQKVKVDGGKIPLPGLEPGSLGTRVSRVRAEYPNHLDYNGLLIRAI